MGECLFCRIIKGDIPSQKVYEDDLIYAFNDINPMAPIHFLVVPKKHISGVPALDREDKTLIGHIYLVISKLAGELGFSENGFRVVVNSGRDGGQTVEHIHFHVLAGRSLEWPPG